VPNVIAWGVRVVSAVLLAGCLGCSANGSPTRAARKFLDKYYVELDQPAALPVVTGSAERKVREEIQSLREARGGGFEAPAHPRVFYRALSSKPGPTERQREAEYQLSIDGFGVKLEKRIRLLLENGDHGWKVSEFLEADLAEPQRVP
jgi:hypothetical protein